MSSTCVICKHKLLLHSYYMQCSVCLSYVHLNCVPMLSRDDPLYQNRNNTNWICTLCIEDAMPFVHLVDDNEFLRCTNANKLSRLDMSIQELNKYLSFSPFELCADKISDQLQDVDPDTHFFSAIPSLSRNSNYYDGETFNEKCSQMEIDQNNFSMIHLNARSLPKNYTNLKAYLACLCMEFTVIGFSETWLSSVNEDLYCFDSYKHVYRHRDTSNFSGKSKGGGVSLFIKDYVEFKCRKDLDIFTEDMESVFIEIGKDQINSDKDVVIGLIYRPPDRKIELFSDYMKDVLDTVKNENRYCHFLGDFNINILNSDSHAATSDFLDLMYSSCYLPLINKPTRVCEHSATLIDNIYTNCFNDHLAGILCADLSDHFPVFLICINGKVKTKTDEYIYKRTFSEYNIKRFKQDLTTFDWESVLYCIQDTQKAFSTFHKAVTDVHNKCFPVKKIKKRIQNSQTLVDFRFKGINCCKE